MNGNDMQTPWQRLAELWRGAGLTIRPGVTPLAIGEVQYKYCVILPNDLREYFLGIDGMEDELDPGYNRFWPLAMVKPVSEELSDRHPDRWAYPRCFLIADHCIWCFAWAVRLDNKPAA